MPARPGAPAGWCRSGRRGRCSRRSRRHPCRPPRGPPGTARAARRSPQPLSRGVDYRPLDPPQRPDLHDGSAPAPGAGAGGGRRADRRRRGRARGRFRHGRPRADRPGRALCAARVHRRPRPLPGLGARAHLARPARLPQPGGGLRRGRRGRRRRRLAARQGLAGGDLAGRPAAPRRAGRGHRRAAGRAVGARPPHPVGEQRCAARRRRRAPDRRAPGVGRLALPRAAGHVAGTLAGAARRHGRGQRPRRDRGARLPGPGRSRAVAALRRRPAADAAGGDEHPAAGDRGGEGAGAAHRLWQRPFADGTGEGVHGRHAGVAHGMDAGRIGRAAAVGGRPGRRHRGGHRLRPGGGRARDRRRRQPGGAERVSTAPGSCGSRRCCGRASSTRSASTTPTCPASPSWA